MPFEFDTDGFTSDISIKVLGVGGGGGNALEYMVNRGVDGVEYIAVNTDVKALRAKSGEMMERIQIGKKRTKGRGAGNNPDIGAESAVEDKNDIQTALQGSTMVFISAGMGGGTGTGAAPIIASIAQEMGILTVGVVTKPFDFEREQKMNQALKGIAEMRKYVDALIIIPNQKLLKLSDRNISMKQAFGLVDDVLYKAVKSIADLVTSSGYVNVDFADVESTLKSAGDAHIAIGIGSGENKAEEAVKEIINSPLLETSISGAGRILINVTLSPDGALNDTDTVIQSITKAAHPEVKVIAGVSFDDDLKDSLIATVIATGFEDNAPAPKAASGEDFEAEAISNRTIIDILNSDDSSDGDEGDAYRDLMNLFKNRN